MQGIVHLSLTILSAAILLTFTGIAAGQDNRSADDDSVVVFQDDFLTYPTGALSAKYTAVQEYHWVPKKPAWGPWASLRQWSAVVVRVRRVACWSS